ncbi:MAG TPA: hypothetical protein VGB74_18160 [Actinoplanes sp.]
MAFRTWAKLTGITVGAAALAGASQLGLAYGLGILRLTRVLEVTTRDQWTAQLSWAAWIAMTAATVGAMTGRAYLPRPSGVGTRIGMAVAAALGAAIVVPLTMQPARSGQVAGVHPAFVIGVCAALGAVVGGFAAYAALSRAASRWGLAAVGTAIWIIAVISVGPSLAGADSLPARLGVLDAAFLDESLTPRTALLTMPLLALVSGALLGWNARRRGMSTLTIALAGLPGPALLTVAYLIAGPGEGADRYQAVPYWGAMTAAGAGVLGSVLTAVLRRGPATDGTWARPEPSKPTPDRPPLPKRDARPESAIARAAVDGAVQRPDEKPRPPQAAAIPMAGATPFDGFTPVQAKTQPAQTQAAQPQAAQPQAAQTQAAQTQPAQTQPAKAGRPKARREPTAISPPLPNPQPVSAPLPRPKPARNRPQQPASRDGDIADWVSGLGGPH